MAKVTCAAARCSGRAPGGPCGPGAYSAPAPASRSYSRMNSPVLRFVAIVLPNLQFVLKRVNELRARGLIQQYAIGGAWAVTYFSEPVPTEDLDVFCHSTRP